MLPIKVSETWNVLFGTLVTSPFTVVSYMESVLDIMKYVQNTEKDPRKVKYVLTTKILPFVSMYVVYSSKSFQYLNQ